MNIQTAAYLDLQYFHRRSAKCPAEHLSLLLEWFTPFFYRHNSFCKVFWVSCFYLSVNIVVLYQFTVTCIENFASKVSRTEKRLKFAITFSGCRWCSREERNGFMLGLHFTPACGLLLVCSLHFTHSLHSTPGPQSEVRSLYFTLTDLFSSFMTIY